MLMGMRQAPGLPALMCLMAMAAGRAVAQDAPVEITTDSVTYCLQLYEKVEQLRARAAIPPSGEVLALSDEGQHMCESGLARGGVMRLRRALTIMTHPDDTHLDGAR